MHYKTLLLFALLFVKQSFAQKNDFWVSFTDPKTKLVGYKDISGNIKIPAKFEDITRADSFQYIIAVMDSIKGSYHWSYLLKNGKKVGVDSVLTIEIIPNCESEGKITFIDKKTDREGVFDKNGIVIIPAMYNYVRSFFNGVAVAPINAMRKLHGERRTWTGGKEVLINTKNEILIDSVDRLNIEDINWYSMRVNAFGVDTNIYVNYKGTHGNTYSFIDYDKEFARWFETKFKEVVYSGSASKLEHYCLQQVYCSGDRTGHLIIQSSKSLVGNFPSSFFKRWYQKDPLKHIVIGLGRYSSIETHNDKTLVKFTNTCGAYFNEKFPATCVSILYYKKRQSQSVYQMHINLDEKVNTAEFNKKYQIDQLESIGFIRTETGYKLSSVSPKTQWP